MKKKKVKKIKLKKEPKRKKIEGFERAYGDFSWKDIPAYMLVGR